MHHKRPESRNQFLTFRIILRICPHFPDSAFRYRNRFPTFSRDRLSLNPVPVSLHQLASDTCQRFRVALLLHSPRQFSNTHIRRRNSVRASRIILNNNSSSIRFRPPQLKERFRHIFVCCLKPDT